MVPLHEIDASAIDELMQVRAEQELLADRMQRMGEMRASVSPIVFARVEKDYRGRAAQLDEQARPLEARTRAEYRKLQSVHKELEAALATARLEQEEREFRHRIGEFDDAAFEQLTREAADRLAERERALAEAEQLRQRFLAAFRSQEELERDPGAAPPAVEPPPVVSTVAVTVQPEPEPAATITSVTAQTPVAPSDDDGVTRPLSSTANPPSPPEPAPAAPPPPPIPSADDSVAEDGTVILPWRAAPPAPSPSGELGATMILPTARLIGQEEGLTEEFHLGPVTYVGRTSECEVRIARPAVSRRHARLDLTPDGGHLLTDLGSENGTYINGARITEQRLFDGDVVAFGTVRFVYKAT